MNMFKVGDKVVIKNTFRGDIIGKISHVHNGEHSSITKYTIAEDNSSWSWSGIVMGDPDLIHYADYNQGYVTKIKLKNS